MDTNDVTTRVLVEIRRRTTGFEARRDRVDRVDSDRRAGFDRLVRRLTETENRLSTESNALAGTLRDVADLLRARGQRRLSDESRDD